MYKKFQKCIDFYQIAMKQIFRVLFCRITQTAVYQPKSLMIANRLFKMRECMFTMNQHLSNTNACQMLVLTKNVFEQQQQKYKRAETESEMRFN